MLKPVKNGRADPLARLSWQEFEGLLAEYYSASGFKVEHVGTAATSGPSDGGIDLKLTRRNEYLLVQCKHWNATQVPHDAVHELLGVMVAEKATGAIIVTNGGFTEAAMLAGEQNENILLIDGVELRDMLGPLLPQEQSVEEPVSENHVSRSLPKIGKFVFYAALIFGIYWVVQGALDKMVADGATAAETARRLSRLPDQDPIPPPSDGTVPTPSPVVAIPPPPSSPAVAEPTPPPVVAAPMPSPAPSTPASGVKPTPVIEFGSANEVMTPAELAEWKRKNEEAMRVIESSTKEVAPLGDESAPPPDGQ